MKSTSELLQHIQSAFNHDVSSCYQCTASFTQLQLKLLCNKTPFSNLRILLFVAVEWCVLVFCRVALTILGYLQVDNIFYYHFQICPPTRCLVTMYRTCADYTSHKTKQSTKLSWRTWSVMFAICCQYSTRYKKNYTSYGECH